MLNRFVIGMHMATMGLGLMGALEVQAATTSSAVMSNVRIQLIDLDPLDGIAPAISFESSWTDSYNQVTANGAPQQTFLTGAALGSGVSPFVSGSGGTRAQLQVLAGDLLTGAGPGSSAFATASGAGNSAAGFAANLTSRFTVTAHTRIVMTADATSVQIGGDLGDYGTAQNLLGLLNLFPDGSTSGSYDSTNAFLTADGQTFTAGPRGLQVTFENTTAAPLTGYALAFSTAMAYGSTSAVPEPQTIALMLAGISVLGTVLRRRAAR